jgi:hypothetical protein
MHIHGCPFQIDLRSGSPVNTSYSWHDSKPSSPELADGVAAAVKASCSVYK